MVQSVLTKIKMAAAELMCYLTMPIPKVCGHVIY